MQKSNNGDTKGTQTPEIKIIFEFEKRVSSELEHFFRPIIGGDESLLPHLAPECNNSGVLSLKGHKRDTIRMGNYSKPKLNKNNPKKWFIYYNYKVPDDLRQYFKRGWERYKVYGGINLVGLQSREKIAKDLLDETAYALKIDKLNPMRDFRDALLEYLAATAPVVRQRTDYLCEEVFPLFIQSREARQLDKTSIVAYQGTIDWLLTGLKNIKAGEVKYTDVSETIAAISTARGWSATTINKEWDFVQTVFNWMALEDYMIKNPIKGKVVKLPTDKTRNKWYDRVLAEKVRTAILASPTPWLINVCQFVHNIWIRSKQELMSIKVGDIDTELHLVHFRKEWAKNSSDETRVYDNEFHELVLSMKLDSLPKHWFIFGKGGQPGPEQCGHNYFSRTWKDIRDDLKLSDDYTIYGWKHTGIVHAIFKGVQGKDITYKARHKDQKTTEEYCRDYDISLQYSYKREDLDFWPTSSQSKAA